jgi:hypothetical protein
MVGYGPEDKHFVIELTYNYGIGSYQMGNDFKVSKIFGTCQLRYYTEIIIVEAH